MGVHVGYGVDRLTYRVWCPEKRKVYHVGVPTFDEMAKAGWWKAAPRTAQVVDDDLSFPDFPAAMSTSRAAITGPPATPPLAISDVVPAPAADNQDINEGNENTQEEAVDIFIPSEEDIDEPAADQPETQEESTTARSEIESLPDNADDFPLDDELSGMPDLYENEEEEEQVPVLRRSCRTNRGVPSPYMANMMMVAMEGTSEDDPKTYKKAMRQSNSAEWMAACATEVASLIENKVFSVVDAPTDKPVITAKWVFKRKRGLLGALEKYKARVVARGFM